MIGELLLTCATCIVMPSQLNERQLLQLHNHQKIFNTLTLVSSAQKEIASEKTGGTYIAWFGMINYS